MEEAQDTAQEEPAPLPSPVEQPDPAIGDVLQARDRVGDWYKARVVKVRGEGETREVKVHFWGWSKNRDEWVRLGIGRLKHEGARSPPRPEEQRELFVEELAPEQDGLEDGVGGGNEYDCRGDEPGDRDAHDVVDEARAAPARAAQTEPTVGDSLRAHGEGAYEPSCGDLVLAQDRMLNWCAAAHTQQAEPPSQALKRQ